MNEEYLDFSKNESEPVGDKNDISPVDHALDSDGDLGSWSGDFYEPVNRVDIDYDSSEYEEAITPKHHVDDDNADFLDELPDEPLRQVMTRFDQIDYNIDALFERIEAFQNLDRLQNIISQQNLRIEQLTNDMAFKSSLPLYRMIIDYIDTLADMLRRQDHMLDMGEGIEQRYNTLFSAVEELQKQMSAGLDTLQVEKFSDVDDNPLDRSERQEVVERQVEENENEFLRYGEDVTEFYRSSAPGYIYRQVNLGENSTGLPVEHVIRPEKIIKVVRDTNSNF